MIYLRNRADARSDEVGSYVGRPDCNNFKRRSEMEKQKEKIETNTQK